MSASKEPSKAGYKNPPKEFQFKPGQSGNPKGRRKRLPEFDEIMSRELKRRRTITEGGKPLQIQTHEILAKRLIDLALKGNMKALLLVMDFAGKIAIREKDDVSFIDPNMSLQDMANLYEQMMREERLSR